MGKLASIILIFILFACTIEEKAPELNHEIQSINYIDSDADGIENIIEINIDVQNIGKCEIYWYEIIINLEYKNYIQSAVFRGEEIGLDETQNHALQIDKGAHDTVEIEIFCVPKKWDRF